MKSSVRLRQRVRKNTIALYLDLYHNGQRLPNEMLGIHLSKDTKEKTANKAKLKIAEDRRRLREEELLRGITHAPRTTDVAGFLRSIGVERGVSQWDVVARHWENFAKHPIHLAELQPKHFEDFERYLVGVGLKQNSVVAYSRKLKAAMNVAITRRLLKEQPFTGARLMNPITPIREYLEIHELERIAQTEITVSQAHRTRYSDKQRDDIKWAFIFCCYQGLRLSDVSTLRDTDVRFVQVDGQPTPSIPKKQQKTQAVLYNMLHPVAWEIIKDRKGRLFDLPPLKLCPHYIKKLVESAGIKKNISFHSSRHTAAMQLLFATDGDLYAVKQHLGHTDIRTTMIYAPMLPTPMVTAVRKMPSINLSKK